MAAAFRIYIDGPPLSGRYETMRRMAELCVPARRYGDAGPLSFRDEKTGVRFEIRRRVRPSLAYDVVDDADKDPQYAEQRDYIASIDLLIFVVDSQRERLEAGTALLESLRSALTRSGRDPDLIPVVFQLNKRDLPNVVAESLLRERFMLCGPATWPRALDTARASTASSRRRSIWPPSIPGTADRAGCRETKLARSSAESRKEKTGRKRQAG